MERKISKKKKKKKEEESKEKKERKRESEKPFNSSESLMANSIMSMLGKMLLILFQNQWTYPSQALFKQWFYC